MLELRSVVHGVSVMAKPGLKHDDQLEIPKRRSEKEETSVHQSPGDTKCHQQLNLTSNHLLSRKFLAIL
jgi:hypothetical protein